MVLNIEVSFIGGINRRTDSNKHSINVVVYFVANVDQSTTACSSFNQVFNCPTNQRCAINSVNGVSMSYFDYGPRNGSLSRQEQWIRQRF
jgi:thiamine pyrophosphokinase